MIKQCLFLCICLFRLFASESPSSSDDTWMGAPIPDCCAHLLPHRACLTENAPFLAYSSVDFLYWQGGMDGLEYAFSNTGSQLDQRGSVQKLSFDWEPAVRVLVGGYLPYDNRWRLDGAFTYFGTTVHTHSTQSIDRTSSNPGAGLIAVWTYPFAFQGAMFGARWAEARAQWRFTAEMTDLLLHHSLWIGKALIMEPAFGLKMAFFKQYYKIDYELGNQTTLHFVSSEIAMKSHSFNLGPAFSFATRWNFNVHWSLFTTLSASLLSTCFTTSRDESDFATNITTGALVSSDFAHIRNPSFWTLRPEVALQLGFTWEDCFHWQRSSFAYALSASYETQYWWKQNMFLRYLDVANTLSGLSLSPTQGDLFFQGLTANVRVDF